MRVKHVSFEEIVSRVSFLLGKDNLRNDYPVLKDMIIDATIEINPYAALLVKKKVTYHKGNGNFDGKNIAKPKDFFELDVIGCCKENICPGDYRMNPRFIILCDGVKRDKVSFSYYGFACDGTGMPFTNVNHKEAVISYIEWMYARRSMNQKNGALNHINYLMNQWEDRCMEARGEDFAGMLKYADMKYISNVGFFNTSADIEDDICECNECYDMEYDDEVTNQDMKNKVYYFQIPNDGVIEDHDITSDRFLFDKPYKTLGEFLNGSMVGFTKIGRYGFVIDDYVSDDLRIQDLTGTELNENTLIKNLDIGRKRLSFFSRNLISHSSIFFKMTK